MPRAVWTGSITFGLVTIPARLFPATEPKDVRFHLTDARGRRVRYRRFVADDEPGTEHALLSEHALPSEQAAPSERDGPGSEEGSPD